MGDDPLETAHERRARIQAGEFDAALEEQADQEIRTLDEQFAQTLNPHIGHLLGWLRWGRHRALDDAARSDEDVGAAVDAFAVCMTAGLADLPDDLLPQIADAAAPYAAGLLEFAVASLDPDRANEAVRLWRDIVIERPEQGEYMTRLGLALRVRFERTGNARDLDQAVAAGSAATTYLSTGDPERAVGLYHWAVSLTARHDLSGAPQELEHAIRLHQSALEELDRCTGDHPDRPAYLSALGGALRRGFLLRGETADLDAAIEAGRESVTSAQKSTRVVALTNLSVSLQTRAAHVAPGGLMHADVDINESIRLGREALALLADDHPERATVLANQASALRLRFEHSGAAPDLADAVSAIREALELTPTHSPEHPRYQAQLGVCRLTQAEVNDASSGLEEAVALLSRACDRTPLGHRERAARLSNLALALQARAERTGRSQDINEAVLRLRSAVDAAVAPHPDRPMYLSNLADVLQVRFELGGSAADLEEATAALSSSLEQTPATHPDRAMRLSNLAVALIGPGRTQDLDAAEQAQREALVLTSDVAPARAGRLNNLANALRARYRVGRRDEDLEAALEVGRSALRSAPDPPVRPVLLANQASTLTLLYERDGRAAHLLSAVDLLHEALAHTAPDSPRLALQQNNLALTLSTLATSEDASTAVRTDAHAGAAQASLVAARTTAATPALRLRAAWHASSLLADLDPQTAAEAAGLAVEQLARLVPRSLRRAEQEERLAELSGLACDAAALALNTTDPPATRALAALGHLERGRVVLLGQALESGGDLSALRGRRPDLAERLADLRRRMDRPENLGSDVSVLERVHESYAWRGR